MPLLCSACFDAKGCGQVLAIKPRQVCSACGRECLGYVGEIPISREKLRELAAREIHHPEDWRAIQEELRKLAEEQ